MKKLFHVAIVGFVLSGILLTVACKRKAKEIAIDPGFTGYIAAFTSGVISNESTIKVRLLEEMQGAEPGKSVQQELFSFSPSIKGKTYWSDRQTLEFVPEKKLPSGKLIECRFFLSKIMDVPSNLKTLTFQFQTIRQSVRVDFNGFRSYELNDLTWQRVCGILFTADNANDIDIEKILSAVQNGKQKKITWEHVGDKRTHNFTIDSVLRSENKGEVILQWDAKLIGSKDKNELVVPIPPLGDFNVMDVSVTQHPEQCITLFFSDPVKQDQDLEGLIHLESGADLRLNIEENNIKVYPQNSINEETTLYVEDGVRNVMGYQLKKKYIKKIKFSNLKPAVELMGKGVILPSSIGLIFPFKAVNLKAVNVKIIKVFENNIAQFLQVNQLDGMNEMKRVGRIIYKKEVQLASTKQIDYGQWNNFSLDLSTLIHTEPGAIYRVHLSFDKKQSLYPCSEDNETELKDKADFDEDPEMVSFDEPGYYYYYEDYEYNYYYEEDEGNYWENRENPCKNQYYRNRSISMNVFASDLGIIAKGGNSKQLVVAVADLKNTEPLSGVEIEIYNYQNQLITKTTTGENGISEIDMESKPFLLVAKKDKQRGYLRLDDGSALSLSMFDVGGQVNKKGVKGFVYGERGVWRPGDSLYISFILEDKNNVIPENHPVVFELFTPENQLYLRKIKTSSVNGFYDFRTATEAKAPTGNWLAKVKVGGSDFTKTIKIETVKPNRLKLNLNFHTKLLRKEDNLNGDLTVKWLHGAIARDLKSDVNVKLAQTKTSFDAYPCYMFDDPAKRFESEEQKLYEGVLDDNGQASVIGDFSVKENAPGMLKAFFNVRVFEKGGDFSVDRFSLPYSPYNGYVGLKIPEGKGWSNALYSNEPNIIPVVTVDQNGKPEDRKNLKIEIFNLNWRWWWDYNEDDDIGSYFANNSSSLLKTDYIETKNGKALYEMNLGGEYWGRKFIRITDPVTGHSAGQVFYTTYKGWWSRPGQDNPCGAEMLSFTTDKASYNIGELVKVRLPGASKGKALVSLESGSKVLQTFWVDATLKQKEFTFKATQEMAPNIYIHVSLLQPHNQTTNDRPIRLYGIQSVTVEDPATHLNPVLNMADVLEPEGQVVIKVSESKGQKMTYTVAMVDEGLLDLTRFETPEPWKQFYAREALGVKTWDLYKYVMGAFSGDMAGLLALGGDENLNKKAKNNANRFKAVVKFLGPFELEASAHNVHTFKMPNYVGSVRTMVVAGYNGAYGSAEKTTPVKKPLMVLATLPRVIGPSESVSLPVTVFAMDKKIKNVTVEVQANNMFILKGDKTKTISFSREGDEVVNFELVAAEKIGIGKVKVIAKSGKEQAVYDIEMDVRNPNPRVTDFIDGVIEPGQTFSTNYTPVGMAGTNHGVVEVSAIPSLKLEERLKFLIQYPHGCIEQTTSSVFPQLYLSDLLDVTQKQKKEIENNINAGINRLRDFQTASGGFAYWPGEMACEWGSNYAGHFLVEAKNKGYSLPPDLLKNWIKFQKQIANSWSYNVATVESYYRSNQLTQSYRLYTLALAGHPALGAMNRLRELKDLTIASKWRLAAAYFLAGKTEVAQQLVNNTGTTVEPYKELSWSYGSGERDEAMILETLTLMKKKNEAKKMMDILARKLASGSWYSTQTTAYSLLAIAKFAGASGKSKAISYEYTVNGKALTPVSSTAPISQFNLNIKNVQKGSVKIKNTSGKRLFVKIQLDGIPLTGDQTAVEKNLQMKLRYLDMDGKEINPENLEQGTDFMAEVEIRNASVSSDYKEMALTQIFPSGWEIKNMRMEQTESSHINDVPRYQDIRDDRVYSYFNLNRYETKTFRILMNASYLGAFYLPTVVCEAMYDNEINARKPGRWVRVTQAGRGGIALVK